MSGIEMKTTDQVHVYPPTNPPPYSPPQPGFGPTMVAPGGTALLQPGTTTVIHGPTVVHRPPLVSAVVVTQQMSPNATVYNCPSCNQQIVTRVERKPSMRTHLFAILLCVLGCWPCACIPYCMDTCNNADHYCPNCNSYIGSYSN